MTETTAPIAPRVTIPVATLDALHAAVTFALDADPDLFGPVLAAVEKWQRDAKHADGARGYRPTSGVFYVACACGHIATGDDPDEADAAHIEHVEQVRYVEDSMDPEDVAAATPCAPATCVLTGAEGENPDDCTTHDHQDDRPRNACTGRVYTAADLAMVRRAGAEALLAEYDEWRESRADLSAAEDDGGADWSESDDAGCDLASRLADALRATLTA